MSLVDTVEIVVHVDELSNLDLLRKGFYALQISCGVQTSPSRRRRARGGGSDPATPVSFSAAPARLGSHSRLQAVSGTGGLVEPGGISDLAYRSRAVHLRYTDERFDLNEVAVFHCDVQRSSSVARRLTLQVALLRADCAARAGGNGPTADDADWERTSPFERVAATSVDLGPLQVGGGAGGCTALSHAYTPVVMDASYLCCASLSVHAALVATRFRQPRVAAEAVALARGAADPPGEEGHSSERAFSDAEGGGTDEDGGSQSGGEAEGSQSAGAGGGGGRHHHRALLKWAGGVHARSKAGGVGSSGAAALRAHRPPRPASPPLHFASLPELLWPRSRLALAASLSLSPPLSAEELAGAYERLVEPLRGVARGIDAFLAHAAETAAAGEAAQRGAAGERSGGGRQQQPPPAAAAPRLLSHSRLLGARSQHPGSRQLLRLPEGAPPCEWREGLPLRGPCYAPTRFPFGVRARADSLLACMLQPASAGGGGAGASEARASAATVGGEARASASTADGVARASAFAASVARSRGASLSAEEVLPGLPAEAPEAPGRSPAVSAFLRHSLPHGGDPERCARVLEALSEEAAAGAYERWRALSRCLARQRFAAAAHLQALYRAGAAGALRARTQRTQLPRSALLEPPPPPRAGAPGLPPLPPAVREALAQEACGGDFASASAARLLLGGRGAPGLGAACALDAPTLAAVEREHARAVEISLCTYARAPGASATPAAAPTEPSACLRELPSLFALERPPRGALLDDASAGSARSGDGEESDGVSAVEDSGSVSSVESSELHGEGALPPLVGTHLVVFLNGLGGSPHDSRTLRSFLKLHQPHCALYALECNTGEATEGDIIAAAARVAEEVRAIAGERLASDGLAPLRALSIVAHSLGGVIARLALRHPILARLRGSLHAFVTLASPHMGLLHSASQMHLAGMYVWQRMRGSVALAQLALADEPSGTRDCLLYLLACGWRERGREADGGAPPTVTATLRSLRAGGFSGEPNGELLALFQHVLLLSSPQDAYAPAPSCGAFWPDAPPSQELREMLTGFFVGARADRVTRVSIRFLEDAEDDAEEARRAREVEAAQARSFLAGLGSTALRSTAKALSSLVGRTAHVAFLETPAVAAFLALGCPGLWE